MHLPERDGVYADLLLLDLFLRERAAGRWPVSRAIARFHELAGPSWYRRVDIHVERTAYPETRRRLLVGLGEQPPTELGGQAVIRTVKEGRMPPCVPTTIAAVRRGQHDGLRVEIRGVVRFLESERERPILHLHDG